MTPRRVKIVCTLGPASDGRKEVLALARAGMDIARLNFSHGDQAEHARRMKLVREVSAHLNRPIGVLADLAGPKVRTGEIPEGKRMLRRGGKVTLSSRSARAEGSLIGTTYPRLAADLEPGRDVLLDDGRIRLVVERIEGRLVHCKVVEGGELGSHKGINLPGVALSAPALTAKDRSDLAFALRQGVDLVALSFVRRADDLRQASRLIRSLSRKKSPSGGPVPPVIAKLEKPQALDELESILEEAGGVMVARGDLGVEIAPEKVPLVQKRIIRLANHRGLPVITATQMLESMTGRSRPTRAEASDVANAVLDGTDAVMLSAETATGRYAVESVKMMDRIIREIEKDRRERRVRTSSPNDAVSEAATTLADSLDATAIVAFTQSGATALRLASCRPATPIVALSPDDAVVRRLSMVWGVTARVLKRSDRLSRLAPSADRTLRQMKLARDGDRIVFVMGYPFGRMGRTNLLKVHTVGERT